MAYESAWEVTVGLTATAHEFSQQHTNQHDQVVELHRMARDDAPRPLHSGLRFRVDDGGGTVVLEDEESIQE